MLKILNRLAWLASFGFAFAFVFLATIMFDLASDRYIFGSDTFLIWLIVVFIFTALTKRIFISANFIAKILEKSGDIVKDIQVKEAQEEILVTEYDLKQKKKRERTKKNAQPLERDMAALAGGIKSAIKQKPAAKDIFSLNDNTQNKHTEEATKISPPPKSPLAKSSGPNIIQAFFQENALAKIGGILLFLAVVFLLQLVYTRIGPIGKLMIGFAFGFFVFVVGLVLDYKEHHQEAKILFGVSILINYLVILSGRYLIGEDLFVKQTILNEGITFFLLMVNTIFAISVAMAYKSRALLFFSFVVAYLNPFLIGGKINLTIYTMLAYSVFVSLGGIFLSVYYKKRDEVLTKSFLSISFVGGNILVLFAPFDFSWQWTLKLFVLGLLSLLPIYYSYKNKNNKVLPAYFVGAYLFFVFLIFNGSFELSTVFRGIDSVLSILVFFVLMVVGGSFFFLRSAINSLFYTLLAPLLIITGMFAFDFFRLADLGYIMVGAMLVYLLVFSSLVEKISGKMSYIFFSALAFFVLFMSVIWNIHPITNHLNVSSGQDFGIIMSIFMFLISAYYFSRRKGLEELYALSSLASVFILFTITERSGNLRLISIISIFLFMILNILWPLLNKQLMYRNIGNFIFGLVVGAIFAVSELFYFWYGSENQSTMHLGLSFVGLAIVYFFVSYLAYQILEHHNQSLSHDDKKASIKDIVYPLVGISISVFSLAIVYIFSKHSEIISAILLFESSLLFYFYQRKESTKIYVAALILMFVGITHLARLIDLVRPGEYLMLIPLSFVFLSFVFSLKFLSFSKKDLRIFHDIGHVLGIFVIMTILSSLTPSHAHGWLMFLFSICTLILSIVYSTIFSGKIKIVFVIVVAFVLLKQITGLEYLFYRLDGEHLVILKIIQYLSTFIFFLSALSFNFISKFVKIKEKLDNKSIFIFNAIFTVYLFVITTQYIYFFFDKIEFVITIYWGILSLILLFYGIQRDVIKLRTVGLYVLSLTVLKILLLDIWAGLDDAIMRVIALMIVGGIMIATSVLYGKKYGDDLKGEFSWENLTDKNRQDYLR